MTLALSTSYAPGAISNFSPASSCLNFVVFFMTTLLVCHGADGTKIGPGFAENAEFSRSACR
jgi:hypothetical protein